MQNKQSFFIGLALLLLPVFAVVLFPQHYIPLEFFLRVIAAVGGGLVGSALPGFLQIELPWAKAGGALAVMLLFFVVDPTKQTAELPSVSAVPLSPAVSSPAEKAVAPSGGGGFSLISGAPDTGSVDASAIKTALAAARTGAYDNIVILEHGSGPQNYIQTILTGDTDNVLEFRDGGRDRHFQCFATAAEVERAFVAYLNGDPAFQAVCAWQWLDL